MCERERGLHEGGREGGRTFSMSLWMIRSDSPLEYMLAVSMVLIPRSYAAFRRGRAWSGGVWWAWGRTNLKSWDETWTNLFFLDDP